MIKKYYKIVVSVLLLATLIGIIVPKLISYPDDIVVLIGIILGTSILPLSFYLVKWCLK